MTASTSFLREFLKTPGKVGAIAPSSPSLAQEIVKQAQLEGTHCVVEFGAGTGSFTRVIVKKAPPEAAFIAIEQSPTLVEILRKELTDTNICCDDAANLAAILHQAKAPNPEAIISGLPWAAFPDELQDKLLNTILTCLQPGGRFVTFAYLQGLLLPAGRQFARKIDRMFGSVTKSPVIWRNLPPAFVYRCVK